MMPSPDVAVNGAAAVVDASVSADLSAILSQSNMSTSAQEKSWRTSRTISMSSEVSGTSSPIKSHDESGGTIVNEDKNDDDGGVQAALEQFHLNNDDQQHQQEEEQQQQQEKDDGHVGEGDKDDDDTEDDDVVVMHSVAQFRGKSSARGRKTRPSGINKTGRPSGSHAGRSAILQSSRLGGSPKLNSGGIGDNDEETVRRSARDRKQTDFYKPS